MNLEDAIRNRRSVRGFLPKEVPEPIMEKVFELAQRAPSGCNVQPWLPNVVSGSLLKRLRGALLEAGAKGVPIKPDWPIEGKYFGDYRVRQYDAAARLYSAMGIERHDIPSRQLAAQRNLGFFGAPHAVFIFLQSPFDTREAADAGMYAQTLMLALTAHGIASCAQGALSLYPSIVRNHLAVPEDHRLLFGISFGYEDHTVKANAARLGRLPVHEAVKFRR